MSNPIETTITPAALLTAAREGKITASIIDAETLPPLAGGDGPEQYPACTIALQIEQPNLTSITSLPGVTGASVKGEREICVEYMTSAAGPLLPILPGTIIDGSNNAGELSDVVIRLGKDIPTAPITLRTLTAWKLVYYSTDGDTMNSGRGTYDFRAIESDGCTRGDATVSILSEPLWRLSRSPRASTTPIPPTSTAPLPSTGSDCASCRRSPTTSTTSRATWTRRSRFARSAINITARPVSASAVRANSSTTRIESHPGHDSSL